MDLGQAGIGTQSQAFKEWIGVDVIINAGVEKCFDITGVKKCFDITCYSIGNLDKISKR